MRKSIYACPHCGAKTFNPLTKSFAGGMNKKGSVCKNCGHHCVNGMPSMIFSAIVYVAALIFVALTYLYIDSIYWDAIMILGAVLAAFVLCRLFDAFIGPLIPAVRNDADS